ncbi:hypothetical protein M0G74_08705 [Microbulbifer sp. CAU 1566]|uniref:hypothetical protein n=1 Tax=Microbulbifer sp. CAU 1566 TaxID=2933269 RepID=UPI002006689F|nr:hypothetical protein [Microbulbifer sp. CAU 1566]MCK7597350.1 hypothetical protein [Microbulbifer sp. CAU 1566]
MLMKTAYIHIGTEKTGSTSIQQLLANNRNTLSELGYHVANIQYDDNHLDFVAYCIDRFPNDQQQALLSLVNINDPIQHLRWKEAFKLKAEQQLSNTRQIKNLVITSEHFHSRIKNVSEVNRLQQLLLPHYNKFKVILYLRRQDQLAASLFNEALKYGGTCRNPLQASHKPSSPYFDYLNLVEMWAYVFGKENLSIRLFEKSQFFEKSLYKDFLRELDISDTKNIDEPPKANIALNGYQQHLLLFFNEITQRHGTNGQLHKELREKIASSNTLKNKTEGFQACKSEHTQFLDYFTEMNRALEKKWLKGNFFSSSIDSADTLRTRIANTPSRENLEDALTREILAYLDIKEQSYSNTPQLANSKLVNDVFDVTSLFNNKNSALIRSKIEKIHP